MEIELNWEIKEVWLENENLKVDSGDWEEKEINWVKYALYKWLRLRISK